AAPARRAAEPEVAGITAEREAMPALRPALVLARARRIETGLQAFGPELVVELALGRVAQDVVGNGDVLELLLGGLVARIHIRMGLARELAMGLTDLVVARPLRDAEDGIVVFPGGGRVAHSPYSSRTFPEAISRSAVTTSLLSLSTSGRAPFSRDFARRAPSS